ncbi:MAG: AGE family epimerase/isomerase [bacterium]|nr:AGE family epimerase/isomerase [bacterium]
MLYEEVKEHLVNHIIPFWKGLRDEEHGGYYGYYDFDLQLHKDATKGCILNSRILWFFSNAYMMLKDESLLKEANHAYDFLVNACYDHKNGGVFWSVSYDGKPEETLKHTYNQAFAIYALSAYYQASGNEQALSLAKELYHLIETKCKDEQGYLEAFDEAFEPVSNEKLSENGVMAEKTMNTLLHVFEGYTRLYEASKSEEVKNSLKWILSIFEIKVYNPKLQRQEVFFDRNWNTLIDLHSYGHDIETSWLIDYGCDLLEDKELTDRMSRITNALRQHIYDRAYVDHSILNECENGVDNTMRIWWVQAEGVVGFLNGFQKENRPEYLEAATNIWNYIKVYLVDHRENSEWFWQLNADRTPDKTKPIVEPWKCPYHNGRMCMEVMRRLQDKEEKVCQCTNSTTKN